MDPEIARWLKFHLIHVYFHAFANHLLTKVSGFAANVLRKVKFSLTEKLCWNFPNLNFAIKIQCFPPHLDQLRLCLRSVTSQLKSLCSLDFEQMDENTCVDRQMWWNSRRSLKMDARVRTEDWRSALSNASLLWMMEGWLLFIKFGGTSQTSDAWMRLQKETEELTSKTLQKTLVSNKTLKSEPEDECLAFTDRRQKCLWQLPQDADRKCKSCFSIIRYSFFMTQRYRQNPALFSYFSSLNLWRRALT